MRLYVFNMICCGCRCRSLDARDELPNYWLLSQPQRLQMLLSIWALPRLLSCGSAPGLRIWILRVGRSTPTRVPASPLCNPHTRSVLGFSRRRPVVLIPATFLSPPVPPKASSLLSFQWASAASFAFSSAIVNAPMRPHSSRPLQYEDGVGGSQRGAPSSGTHTGDRRAGKRRHGKSPEASRNSGEWRRFAAVGRPTRRWREAAETRCASIRLRFVEQQRNAVWGKTRGSVIVLRGDS